jgi:hypothetical protein
MLGGDQNGSRHENDGQVQTKAAAEKAMAGMKECKG